jgi:hypothetical protein
VLSALLSALVGTAPRGLGQANTVGLLETVDLDVAANIFAMVGKVSSTNSPQARFEFVFRVIPEWTLGSPHRPRSAKNLSEAATRIGAGAIQTGSGVLQQAFI